MTLVASGVPEPHLTLDSPDEPDILARERYCGFLDKRGGLPQNTVPQVGECWHIVPSVCLADQGNAAPAPCPRPFSVVGGLQETPLFSERSDQGFINREGICQGDVTIKFARPRDWATTESRFSKARTRRAARCIFLGVATMKKHPLFLAAFALVALFLLASCSQDAASGPEPPRSSISRVC
jgi:hypothetical protein